jgi:hypothetical protein
VNPFEQAARERKTARLVEVADRTATEGGLSPHDPAHAAGILGAWRNAPPVYWARLAVLAGCRPPSDETRAAVLAVFERRAQRRAS